MGNRPRRSEETSSTCHRCGGPVKPYEGAGGRTLYFHTEIGKPCIKKRAR